MQSGGVGVRSGSKLVRMSGSALFELLNRGSDRTARSAVVVAEVMPRLVVVLEKEDVSSDHPLERKVNLTQQGEKLLYITHLLIRHLVESLEEPRDGTLDRSRVRRHRVCCAGVCTGEYFHFNY